MAVQVQTEVYTASGPEQVRIQLSTRDPGLELPEKTGPILVSTNLRRYALSSLVNTLLESEAPIPLEFLINGSFLRTSLSEYLTTNGISAETLLSIEYIRALLPPSHAASFQHDDWVGSVDVLSGASPACVQSNASVQSGHERILSGSYDGLLRVWDMSGNVVATSVPPEADGRIQSILAAKFISPSRLVSGGLDARLRVWNLTNGPDASVITNGTTQAQSLTCSHELYGHTAPVQSLEVHAPSSRILSASDDHTAMLWSTESPANDATLPSAPANLLPSAFQTSSSLGGKRRRYNPGPVQAAGSLLTLRGHTAPVSAAIFSPRDSTVAYTASRDRTLQTFDLTTGAAVASRTPAAHVGLSSLCAMPSLSLLAAGAASRAVLLVDPRANATHSTVMSLRGHKGEVSSVAAQPAGQDGSGAGASSSYGLVSGSYDGTCRVWDLRNAKAGALAEDSGDAAAAGSTAGAAGKVGEASFRVARQTNPNSERVAGAEGVKVFGVVWDTDVGIVSGGEDKRVQIDRLGR